MSDLIAYAELNGFSLAAPDGSDDFSIEKNLNGIDYFEIIVANTEENRAIITNNVATDLLIRQVEPDSYLRGRSKFKLNWVRARKYSSPPPETTVGAETVPSWWLYEQQISMSIPTTKNNQVVKVELTPANFNYAHAKANGEDIRFYSPGWIFLEYWIQTWNPSGTSTLWIKIDTIGTSSFTMLFGRPTATAVSNGDLTFDFFADFEGTSLDTTKWQTHTADAGTTISQSGGVLRFDLSNAYVYTGGCVISKSVLPTGDYIVQTAVKMTSYYSSAMGAYAGFTDTTTEFDSTYGNPNTLIVAKLWSYTAFGKYLALRGDYIGTIEGTEALTISTIWFKLQTIYVYPTYIKGIWTQLDSPFLTKTLEKTGSSGIAPLHVTLGVGDYQDTQTTSFQFVFVRKYVANEPVTSVGIETAAISPFDYSRTITITPQTSFPDYQILVTLSPANFDYGHVQPTGNDIRFITSVSGVFLPYFVNYWDPVGISEFFVKVFSEDTEEISMLYGNATMSSASDAIDTFAFWSSFENLDTNIWDYSGDVSVANGEVILDRSGNIDARLWLKNALPVTEPYILEVKYQHPHSFRNRAYLSDVKNGNLPTEYDYGFFNTGIVWQNENTNVNITPNTWYILRWIIDSTDYRWGVYSADVNDTEIFYDTLGFNIPNCTFFSANARADDTPILVRGRIGRVSYLSEQQIRLLGAASSVSLAQILHKKPIAATAVGGALGFQSGIYTNFTTQANNSTINDVYVFLNNDNRFLIGANFKFDTIKIKYSTPGVLRSGSVNTYYSKGTGLHMTAFGCYDETRALTEPAGTYYILFSPPVATTMPGWVLETFSGLNLYWFWWGAETADTIYSISPKIDQIWVGNSDLTTIFRVDTPDINISTIMNAITESTGYTWDYDGDPEDLLDIISPRSENQSKLELVAQIMEMWEWTDTQGFQRAHEWWVDPEARTIHLSCKHGKDFGDISADFSVLNNDECYEDVANFMVAVGSFTGETQYTAVGIHPQSQRIFGTRQKVLSDLRAKTTSALQTQVKLALVESAEPKCEVKAEMYTGDWLLPYENKSSWDRNVIHCPNVFFGMEKYFLYYSGSDGVNWSIGTATSVEGMEFTQSPSNPVLEYGIPDSWDDKYVYAASVMAYPQSTYCYYTGNDGTTARIGLAISGDGSVHEKYTANPILDKTPYLSWDGVGVSAPSIRYKAGVTYMYYTGAHRGFVEDNYQIGLAISADGKTFTKYVNNPILSPSGSGWEQLNVRNAVVLEVGSTMYMYYTGDGLDVARIGVATSTDGTSWTKYPGNPIITNNGPYDGGGAANPEVLYKDGVFYMFYDGTDQTITRILKATSTDGYSWTKQGSIFGIQYYTIPYFPEVYLHDDIYYMYYTYTGQVGILTSSDLSTWTELPGNPVLTPGASGQWDDASVSNCGSYYYAPVSSEKATFFMYYAGSDGTNYRIGKATSIGGEIYVKYPGNPILDVGANGTWDDVEVTLPYVIRISGIYYMVYTGFDGTTERVGFASSSNSVTFTKYPGNPILDVGSPGTWDDAKIYGASILQVEDTDWSYRRNIFLSPATSLANQQITVILTPSNFNYAHVKANGEDIRFREGSNQPLSYYIQSWNPSGNSIIIVKVQTSGTDTICLLYGNSEAESESNLDATYMFADLYPGTTLNQDKWTEDAVNNIDQTINNYFRFEDTTKVTIITNADTGAQHQAKWTPVSPFIAEWTSKISDTDGAQTGEGSIALVGADNKISAYISHIDSSTSAVTPQVGAIFVEATTGTAFSVSNNDERDFKYVVNGTAVSIYEKEHSASTYNLKASGTSTDIAKLALAGGSLSGYPFLDYIQITNLKVRKYVASEPVATVGAEGTAEYFNIYYGGSDGTTGRIGLATTITGAGCIKYAANPILNLGAEGEWDDAIVYMPSVVLKDGTYYMYYIGANTDTQKYQIGLATSIDGIAFTKSPNNPVVLHSNTFTPMDIGDTIVVNQPRRNIVDKALRIMRVTIHPLLSEIELGSGRVHLEDVDTELRTRLRILDTWRTQLP